MAEESPFLVPVLIDDMREDHARVPEEFVRTHLSTTASRNGAMNPNFSGYQCALRGHQLQWPRTSLRETRGAFAQEQQGRG
jgi:hypothetical protein